DAMPFATRPGGSCPGAAIGAISSGPVRPPHAPRGIFMSQPERMRRWPVRRIPVVPLLAVLSVAACGAADAPDRALTTTREILPSGATLVRHVPADNVPVTWRLEEELRIGALDGDGPDQFGRVGGLAVGENGEIVVLDAQAQELRVFSAEGEHV